MENTKRLRNAALDMSSTSKIEFDSTDRLEIIWPYFFKYLRSRW